MSSLISIYSGIPSWGLDYLNHRDTLFCGVSKERERDTCVTPFRCVLVLFLHIQVFGSFLGNGLYLIGRRTITYRSKALVLFYLKTSNSVSSDVVKQYRRTRLFVSGKKRREGLSSFSHKLYHGIEHPPFDSTVLKCRKEKQ